MLTDLRFAFRMLAKNLGFTAIAVFTLALGICGVTTQFSVIDAALLKGLPFPEPDRLVRLAVRAPAIDPEKDRNLTVSDVHAFMSNQQSFEGLASYFTAGSFILTVKDTPQRFNGSHVTVPFFSLLGVRPVMGRDFTEADNRPEAERVTIISDKLWKDEFGADPNAVGRRVRLNGKPATVVGVMPAGLEFPRDLLWMPMFNEYPLEAGAGSTANALARLKPGATPGQAQAELQAYLQRAAAENPDPNAPAVVARLEPLRNEFVAKPARQLLGAVFAAVLAVLVIACANVMNMQFARATARWRELSVRAALGASRLRLVRQMLIESFALAAIGGTLGALLSLWSVGAFGAILRAMPGQSIPAWMEFRIDGRVLGFSVGATALAVVMAGLLPAFLAARTSLVDALKDSSRGDSGRTAPRIAASLATGQIALTCALLVCSLLLLKSVSRQHALDFGYDLGSVLAGRMNLEAEYRTADECRAAIRRILDGLRESDTVTHAAFTTRRNMMSNDFDRMEIEGRPSSGPEDLPEAWLETVSDGYFEALGIKPLEGREFERGDAGEHGNVLLVNASFARKYFGGESAVGRRIRPNPQAPWFTIAGVVPDTLMQGPVEKTRDGAGMFIPLSVNPRPYLTLVVRGREAADALAKSIGREVAKIEPNLAVYNLGTPKYFFANALGQGRAMASLFGTFAAVSIILSAIGLYGVMSFAVGRRTREIGVRMALGAQKREIVGMVIAQGARQLAIGAALGIVLALALAKFASASIANSLYKVSPHDPSIYLAVVALLAAATLGACWIPARRAAQVDPMTALKAE